MQLDYRETLSGARGLRDTQRLLNIAILLSKPEHFLRHPKVTWLGLGRLNHDQRPRENSKRRQELLQGVSTNNTTKFP